MNDELKLFISELFLNKFSRFEPHGRTHVRVHCQGCPDVFVTEPIGNCLDRSSCIQCRRTVTVSKQMERVFIVESLFNNRCNGLEVPSRNKKSGAKFKVALISEQTVRLLDKLKQQIKSEFFFELIPEDLCFSHPRKNLGVRYIYSELANKRLRSTATSVGIDLAGRTQYSMRHTWETDNFGLIPDDLRNMIMGHKKTRKEYVHLDADKAVARLFTIVQATTAISKLDSEENEK